MDIIILHKNNNYTLFDKHLESISLIQLLINVAVNVINEYSLSFDFVLLLRSHSTTEELVGAVAS